MARDPPERGHGAGRTERTQGADPADSWGGPSGLMGRTQRTHGPIYSRPGVRGVSGGEDGSVTEQYGDVA